MVTTGGVKEVESSAFQDVWILKKKKTTTEDMSWFTPVVRSHLANTARTRWPPSGDSSREKPEGYFFNRSRFRIWLLSIATFSFSLLRLKKQVPLES